MSDPIDPNAITDAIAENAAGPKKAMGDGQSIEQHSLPDQIAAAEFAAAQRAVTAGRRGFRLSKMIPPGCSS